MITKYKTNYLIGKTFKNLKVLEFVKESTKSGFRERFFLCQCKCGYKSIQSTYHIISKKRTSKCIRCCRKTKRSIVKRNDRIIELRESGCTYRAIAKNYDISYERIRQILQKRKIIKHSANYRGIPINLIMQ